MTLTKGCLFALILIKQLDNKSSFMTKNKLCNYLGWILFAGSALPIPQTWTREEMWVTCLRITMMLVGQALTFLPFERGNLRVALTAHMGLSILVVSMLSFSRKLAVVNDADSLVLPVIYVAFLVGAVRYFIIKSAGGRR